MIALRRSAERQQVRRTQRDVWSTFRSPETSDPFLVEFQALIALDESRISPGAYLPSRLLEDAEVITYVLEGTLASEDSRDGSGVLCAGEFQRRAAAPGVSHREANVSRTESARVFRISFPARSGALRAGQETKRFSIAQRHGVLCAVASPDGHRGSLQLQTDARVYSAIIDAGRHLVHQIASRSSVWLHIVTGEVNMADVVLTAGDGVGVTEELTVSLIAQENSELLLIGLAEPRPATSAGIAP